MPSAPAKSARLDTRITPDLLDQVRRAAGAQSRSVSDYVAATLEASVRRDMADNKAIRMSREASERFAQLLIDPPPVSPVMKAAFQHRRLLVEAR